MTSESRKVWQAPRLESLPMADVTHTAKPANVQDSARNNDELGSS